MQSGNLNDFGAYRNALELFDLGALDVGQFLRDRQLERLVSQQLAATLNTLTTRH